LPHCRDWAKRGKWFVLDGGDPWDLRNGDGSSALSGTV